MTTTREKVGSFWVDTGTVLLGEPCRFLPGPADDLPRTWLGFADLFTEPAEDHVVVVQGTEFRFPRPRPDRTTVALGSSRAPAGVAIRVGTDGWCHVFVERDPAGEVCRLVVEVGQVTQ